MALRLPKIVRPKKRLGRGIGGRGAKSGRGMKGQRSRAGYHRKAGFEGGQTPLYMRLPKGRGSKQVFRSQATRPFGLSVRRLSWFAPGTIVGPGQLHKRGWLPDRHRPVKLIGTGQLDRKLTVRVHAATAAARQTVEQAGGKVEIIQPGQQGQ